jgi:restriction system protein
MPINRNPVPTFDKLMNPTLRALHKRGGSASIQELVDEIIIDLRLPEDVTNVPHGKGSQTEVEYRSAWARNYLKNIGLIENSDRGIWALTSEGTATAQVDPREVVRTVHRKHRENRSTRPPSAELTDTEEEPKELDWRNEVSEMLLAIPPEAFERLCQRLLREAGFIEVEVTGRTGDGGIDGHGTIRIGGLISFNVLFQSKRHRNNIGPDTVRDFRGAMIGRADKGLIITTGGFTRDARKEATRDGAPPIDLIDGELLAEKLKELRLGIEVTTVERVSVRKDWFEALGRREGA